MISTTTPALATADLARVTAAAALLGATDTASALAAALPSLDEDHRTALAGHVTLDHVALLIFPETLDGLAEELTAQGFPVGRATRTLFETVEIIVWRQSATRFRVETWRSFAPWLWDALNLAAGDLVTPAA